MRTIRPAADRITELGSGVLAVPRTSKAPVLAEIPRSIQEAPPSAEYWASPVTPVTFKAQALALVSVRLNGPSTMK